MPGICTTFYLIAGKFGAPTTWTDPGVECVDDVSSTSRRNQKIMKFKQIWQNMSFPLFVLPLREIPKAKLIPEGLFTIRGTFQGLLYIGKHRFE